MGYNVNASGFTNDVDGNEAQYVYAPKNGKAGMMVPGKPNTWRAIGSGKRDSEEGKRQYRSANEARARYVDRGGVIQSKSQAPDVFDPNPLATFMGETDGGMGEPLPINYQTPEVKPEPPADPTPVGPTPPVTTTNALGVTQTMRNLSGSLTLGDAVNYLNSSTGGYVQGFGKDWNTGPLPTTEPGETQARLAFNSVKPDSAFRTDIKDAPGASAAAAAPTADMGVGADSNKVKPENYTDQGGNYSQYGQFKGTLSEALQDQSSLRFDASKYKASENFEAPAGTMSNESMARRGAFLNADSTLDGMKAVKAMNNTFSLGSKDYAVGEDGLTPISGQQQRDILSGKAKAQDFLKSKVDALTEDSGDTPSAQQDPPVLGDDSDSSDIDPNSFNVPGRKFQPGGGFQ